MWQCFSAVLNAWHYVLRSPSLRFSGLCAAHRTLCTHRKDTLYLPSQSVARMNTAIAIEKYHCFGQPYQYDHHKCAPFHLIAFRTVSVAHSLYLSIMTVIGFLNTSIGRFLSSAIIVFASACILLKKSKNFCSPLPSSGDITRKSYRV